MSKVVLQEGVMEFGNRFKKDTSTSKDKSLSTSNSTSKTGDEVNKTVDYLISILNPKDETTALLRRIVWRCNEQQLIRLAVEAKETDKRGNPTKLFVWLAKDRLGYK